MHINNAILDSSKVIPGKTYFHVYGYKGRETDDSMISEIVAESVVNYHPFFDVSDDSLFLAYHYPNTPNHSRYGSVNDLGMDCEPYNQNRIFSTLEDAKDFVKRLQSDMLTYDEIKINARGDIISAVLCDIIQMLNDNTDFND